MKTSLTVAALAALGAGAAIAACGSSGTGSSSGSNGSGSGGSASSAGHGASGTGTSASSATMSTGTGFDAGSHDGSFLDGDACGSMALTGTVTPGNIVVVFDQSDSMSQKFKEADGGTAMVAKWQAAETALVQAITPIENLLQLGAVFIPTGANGACTVAPIGTPPQIPIEPGTMFLTDFQGHFSATGWSLILGTPLKQGLDRANAALTPAPKGQSAVVILTDGAPNCGFNTLAAVEPPIQAMASRGIKTYVIGLPGSAGASALLDGLASAGGTMTYYSPGDPTELQNQLSMIASNTIDQCTITLSPPPPNPNEVYLIVTDPANPAGTLIPRGDGGGDGWTLSSDGMTATLSGSVCTTAKNGGYTTVQFVYGCPQLPT